ncbi:hypothetical protein HJC23_005214 [Cyclotella cryptica]|uniref:alpha-1,2-Mannosidase n=1 Tax=Cyclotella cryptica TaxID=29204 RepID=A0ABD3P2L3_9STRA|eukprot:CCRYP_017798-RC/>CCRYP_017798-RC protein AED:0.03 eAED:0.03 QI:62/1/1/1/0.5/0.2/5/3618/1597
MSPTRTKQIPALCCFVAISILCCWFANLSEADESSSRKKTPFSLADLFSSFSSSTDGSATISTTDGTLTLSSEQLSAILDTIDPNAASNTREGGSADHKKNSPGGKPSRRKVLYDLSVRAHYEMLLRTHGKANTNSSTTKEEQETVTCSYYNEGIKSLINIRNGGGDSEHSIFSQLSYWTFKICPGETIQQIHLEPTTVTSENKDGGQDYNGVNENTEDTYEILMLPPNSIFFKTIHFVQTSVVDLGTYNIPTIDDEYYSKIKSSWGEKDQDMYKSSTEYYFHGSSCLWTPTGSITKMMKYRRSKIVYEDSCCQRTDESMDEFFEQSDKFMVLSVTEPEICQYVVKLCRICSNDEVANSKTGDPQTARDDSSISSVDPSDFVHLMQTYLHHQPEIESATTFGHIYPFDSPGAFPPMPPSQIEANKKLLLKMFTHAYDSYMYNAFPASELHPLSCSAGTFHLVRIPALTLIDTLDTLIIMRNFTEFARSVERIRYLDSKMKKEHKYNRNDRKEERGGLFSVNQNVSLFETTIRVLGGLLSAHQLALAFMNKVVPKSDVFDSSGEILWGQNRKESFYESDIAETRRHTGSIDDGVLSLSDPHPCTTNSDTSHNRKRPKNSTESIASQDCWTYDGFLLKLAHDIGHRLIHAFDTKTGIPYGTVNLLRGVPSGESEVASLAGAGTLTLEFELLSRLIGDPSFGLAAKRASRALWLRRSPHLDLLGKHIDVKRGVWTEVLSGIGSNSDSFYEYLIKHYVLFPDDDDFWTMFVAAYAGVWKNSRLGDWYVDVDMGRGLHGHVRQVFESLMAFYPGMQILLGELAPAAKSLGTFFLVREFLGLLPERFDFVHWRTEGTGDVHPLRPELLESAYFLHLASIGLYGSKNGPCSDSSASQHTSSWLWAADFALHAIMRLSWTSCGFATVKKVAAKSTGSLDFVNGISGNPQKEQKRLNIKHHNEMPSFFLSETMKYLYLLFDAENNILHQDSERDWIFTTEAHPIHHVPISSSNISNGPLSETLHENGNLIDQMEKIRLLLNEQRALNQTSVKECRINETCYFDNRNALPESLLENLRSVQNVTLAKKLADFKSRGLQKGPPFHLVLPHNASKEYGIFSSEVSGVNYASHRPLREGKGSGTSLRRKCPNFHHPRLTWTLALHGHTLDYNVAHVASFSDFDRDETVDATQTALASACFYGTDFYSDGIIVDPKNGCPFQTDVATTKMQTQGKKNINDASNFPIPGSTRYDMGSNLGMFDVSAFSNGEGFIVRHVDSGELLEVSMFSDDIAAGNAVILVVLTTPTWSQSTVLEASIHEAKHSDVFSPLSLRKAPDSLKKMFKESGSPSDETTQDDGSAFVDELPTKRVVLADMNGHSFNCEVIVTRHGKDDALARVPCSPGFFGKAHIENLIKSEGINVKGPLKLPPKDDELGCETSDKHNELDANNFCVHSKNAHTIQIVMRGECNFAQKTLNQLIQRQAAAVIIVNSNPNELFCMAGEKEKPFSADGCSQMDLPPSVLVSGNDGELLMGLLEEEYSEANEIEAVVNLSRQSNDSAVFPHVLGSENTLQILASNGWGTQAVRQVVSGKGETGNTGWQLFITAHETSAT